MATEVLVLVLVLVLVITGGSIATHNPLPALPWVGVASNNAGRDPGLSFQH